MLKKTHEVFGVSPNINYDSYVDRGDLDTAIGTQLQRRTHIALRGASKCGKSWLRQKLIPDAIVVQCRLATTLESLYTDVLSQLGIKLTISQQTSSSLKGKVEATSSSAISLILNAKVKLGLEKSVQDSKSEKIVGHDINDLRFIAEIIKCSEKRIIIEDFHYLPLPVRTSFAFDLKALWDYQCFIVIIGVWSKTNLLITLNQDLAGRIHETEITWTKQELLEILNKGCDALKIKISKSVSDKIVEESYGNAGLLQTLALMFLDEEKVIEEKKSETIIGRIENYTNAAVMYAGQLEPRYQKFAKDVSSGIRKRTDSSGIYAHTMAVLMDVPDAELITGYNIDEIYTKAHGRESRIQKGNLRTILQKIESLQVDEEGRGLVLSYNDQTSEVTAVDRTLLFYRRYTTQSWPWDDIIKNSLDSLSGDQGN